MIRIVRVRVFSELQFIANTTFISHLSTETDWDRNKRFSSITLIYASPLTPEKQISATKTAPQQHKVENTFKLSFPDCHVGFGFRLLTVLQSVPFLYKAFSQI